MWLTDDSPVFFDTDCVSSFLSVGRLDIVVKLFGQRIRVPSEVLRELDGLQYHPTLGHIPSSLRAYIAESPQAEVQITIGSPTHKMYEQLKEGFGGRRVGSGESAVMACAYQQRGVVASNNLSDVRAFCEANGIELICTQHTLVGAVVKGVIAEVTARKVWHHMARMGNSLPRHGFRGAWERFAGGLLTASSSEE